MAAARPPPISAGAACGVRLHARSAERLAPLRARGGIEARGVQQGLVPVDLMTTDLAEAVRGADLIMLVVPSIAHEPYARALAPLLARRPADLPQSGAHRRRTAFSPRTAPRRLSRGGAQLRDRDADLHHPHGGAGDRQHLQLHHAAALRRPAGPQRRRDVRADQAALSQHRQGDRACWRPGSATSTRSSIRPA